MTVVRFLTSATLTLLGTATLFACSGETFRARDEALAGESGHAGSSASAGAGPGSGGAGASSNAGASGSAHAGSGSVMNGDGGAEPNAGSGSIPVGGNAGALGGAGSASMAGMPAVAGAGGALTAGAGGVGSSGLGGMPTGGAGGSSGASAAGGAGGETGEIIGGCGRQLLHNANFDAGPTAEWSERSDWSPGLDIIVASDSPALVAEMVAPDSGNYLAWLGGIPDNQFDHHVVILEQTVAIPADAGLLTLSGKTWVKTEEDESVEADQAYLEFSLDDVVEWQAKSLTNLDSENGSGWVAFTASTSSLERMRGRTLTLVAYSRTDPTLKTSFFIDSLRLEATCDR
jgi:hypothetical protein